MKKIQNIKEIIMNILLVNDDGINSEKLKITKEILSQFGDVTTIAPSKEQSAQSMALTYGGTTYKKIDDNTYSVDGTPVDCTSFALIALGLKPDLVVSGTNNGYNIGIDVRYSGTVGAALQAQYFGIPTIALSSDYKGTKMIFSELKNTLQFVFDNKLVSSKYTININLPQDSFNESKGIMMTKIYSLVHPYKPALLNNKYIPNRVYEWIGDIPKDSEQYAFLNGYTSISKIKL